MDFVVEGDAAEELEELARGGGDGGEELFGGHGGGYLGLFEMCGANVRAVS